MDGRFACTHKWLFRCKTSNFLVCAEFLHQSGHIHHMSRLGAPCSSFFFCRHSVLHTKPSICQISCGTSDHFAAAPAEVPTYKPTYVFGFQLYQATHRQSFDDKIDSSFCLCCKYLRGRHVTWQTPLNCPAARLKFRMDSC